MDLGKYSLGIGDRFAHQGKSQLAAIKKAKAEGLNIIPVWNKSYREHQIINSKPLDTRREADSSVKSLEWKDICKKEVLRQTESSESVSLKDS